MSVLTFGSLFAGIGGIDLGLEWSGMKCIWQVEINDYATKVLQKHWPDVTRFRDVRDCGKHNLEKVDVIAGGFPCQDVSLAGKQKGLSGKRSTLWSEFYRIICEIRPRWVLVENVPGLLSNANGRFFSKILRELAEVGYDAEWNTIPASDFGAPHKRKRCFILAYPNNTRCDNEQILARQLQTQRQPQLWKSFRTISNRIWLEDYCKLSRNVDGVPDRVDRLKCLGNAVVPQVAEWIGRKIIRFSETEENR